VFSFQITTVTLEIMFSNGCGGVCHSVTTVNISSSVNSENKIPQNFRS